MSDDLHRKIPGSRFGRFARVATLGLRTGASMLLDGDGSAAAKRAADVLGTLRGIAAKVGQMASYVDGVVPEAQREAYEGALKKLRDQTPRSSPTEVRALVESELSSPLDALFAEWSEEPIASASIGQVHRAVLHDGREVAVKVQHSNVAKAIEADLSNMSMLQGFAGWMAGPNVDMEAIFEVIRERLREELDYLLEAEHARMFIALHAADGGIRVPEPIDTHTSKRVLTTTFAHGKGFDEACAADASLRRAWTETIWRFVFRGTLIGGLFNGDPHPGNYVFHDDGSVTFLDYGCVQRLSDAYKASAGAMHRAALAGDEAAFRVGAAQLLDARPGRLAGPSCDYARRCFEPIFAPRYRITREYAAELVDAMKELARFSKTVPKEEFFDMPREIVFINRLQFGLYSVLARLDVAIDYQAVERVILSAHGEA